jgi:hypothetical protein
LGWQNKKILVKVKKVFLHPYLPYYPRPNFIHWKRGLADEVGFLTEIN